MLERTHYRHA